MSKLEEIQARRAKLREAHDSARLAQEEIDYAALADAEEEHGYGSVKSIVVESFKAGCPTLAVVKSPGGTAFYKRYSDQVRNAKGDAKKVGEAQELMGQGCMIYPPVGEVRKAMAEAFPGLFVSAGIVAVRMAELDAEEEKKG